MAIFNALTKDPQLSMLIVLVVISLLSLVISLTALFLERQGHQSLQQRLIDLSHQLIEQQEDYKKLEQLQNLGDQRHHLMDQVTEDIYGLIKSNSQRLDQMRDHPTPSSILTTEAPSQSSYENAIRMAKEGMSGEKIQHLYGLTEGEVNLILDLHQ
jgi:signal transduction histidine kinase